MWKYLWKSVPKGPCYIPNYINILMISSHTCNLINWDDYSSFPVYLPLFCPSYTESHNTLDLLTWGHLVYPLAQSSTSIRGRWGCSDYHASELWMSPMMKTPASTRFSPPVFIHPQCEFFVLFSYSFLDMLLFFGNIKLKIFHYKVTYMSALIVILF